MNSNRNLTHRDAGGGSRSLHHQQTLALPDEVEHGSLTALWEMLIKIGTKIVRHSCYITFQLAEVAIPRALFAKILCLILDRPSTSGPGTRVHHWQYIRLAA